MREMTMTRVLLAVFGGVTLGLILTVVTAQASGGSCTNPACQCVNCQCGDDCQCGFRTPVRNALAAMVHSVGCAGRAVGCAGRTVGCAGRAVVRHRGCHGRLRVVHRSHGCH